MYLIATVLLSLAVFIEANKTVANNAQTFEAQVMPFEQNVRPAIQTLEALVDPVYMPQVMPVAHGVQTLEAPIDPGFSIQVMPTVEEDEASKKTEQAVDSEWTGLEQSAAKEFFQGIKRGDSLENIQKNMVQLLGGNEKFDSVLSKLNDLSEKFQYEQDFNQLGESSKFADKSKLTRPARVQLGSSDTFKTQIESSV